ncbi:MAG: glycosyltransferase family 9 protein [Flavobacteriales bacterium]
MTHTISAVIITRNEAANIERCLESLKTVAEELIIVDSGSSDDTVHIAESLGAMVINSEWLGYARTKNLGHEHASHNYILSIDADEVLSPELASSILEAKSKGLSGVFNMNRLTNYCGSWIKHSGWYPDTKIRLFPKSEVSWEGKYVHETLNIPQGTEVTHLNGDLFHYSYKDQIDHRARADKYSKLTALKFSEEGKSSSPLKPFTSGIVRFIKMYILKLGFLDGKAGLQIAWISALSNAYKYKELKRVNQKKKLALHLKHILISRTDSLGDVMLTLPMTGMLKAQFPDAKISFLGKNYTEALITSCAHIDQYISYDELTARSESEQVKFLSSLNADAVIHVLPNKSLASMCKAAKIPVRVGTSRRLYHLLRCNRFVHFTRKGSDLHESQLNVRMLEALHCNAKTELKDLNSYYGFSAQMEQSKLVLTELTSIILHPKSQGSAPEWPLERFQILANKLADSGYQVYVTGTKKEGDLIRANFTFSNHITDVTGIFDLNELISFIGQCDGLIAASTGPLHLAAALGVNTLGLYTTERPMHAGRWAPVGKHAAVISAEAVNNELEISPNEVYDLMHNMLSRTKRNK